MSSTPSSGRGGKSNTKTVVIKLPGARLAHFPHDKPTAKSSKASSGPSTPSAAGKESPPSAEPPQDAKGEITNENDTSLSVPSDGKKKGGARGGVKRGAGATADGLPRPRAKPGPKRRKLDGPGIGEDGKPWTQSAPTGGHKLGPKANQGAINAGLRALDRSGAPCRKWKKSGFSVKSFTGIVWDVPTWSAPKREVKDEADENQEPKVDGDGLPIPSSSNIGSETSRQNANETNENNENHENNESTDSPAPMIPATA